MSFFKNFERINYQDQTVVNIFNSILMKYNEIDTNSLYFKHTIQPGEKPEHIAYDVYKNANLHWIILLANKIVDPNFDWYLSGLEVGVNTASKYDNSDGHHHYREVGEAHDHFVSDYTEYDILTKKTAGDPDAEDGYVSVTNLVWEIGENDKKQIINIISPTHVPRILIALEEMLSDDTLYLQVIESL